MATEKETLIVAGREMSVSNPRKVLFPKAGHTKLDLVQYYLAVAEGALRGAGGRPNVLVRYPNGIGERVLLSEAGARSRGRRGSKSWRCSFHRAAAPKRSCRASRGAGLDGQPRVPRAASPSRARGRSRSSRRVARGSRSGPRHLVAADPRGGPRSPGGAHGLRSRRLAKDVRLARHARLRAHRARWTFTEVRRAALALAREVERRAPPWRRANGGRRNATACSSTTTRTPRIAPWPPLIRFVRRPTPACRRRSHGTRSTPAIRVTSR